MTCTLGLDLLLFGDITWVTIFQIFFFNLCYLMLLFYPQKNNKIWRPKDDQNTYRKMPPAATPWTVLAAEEELPAAALFSCCCSSLVLSHGTEDMENKSFSKSNQSIDLFTKNYNFQFQILKKILKKAWKTLCWVKLLIKNYSQEILKWIFFFRSEWKIQISKIK